MENSTTKSHLFALAGIAVAAALLLAAHLLTPLLDPAASTAGNAQCVDPLLISFSVLLTLWGASAFFRCSDRIVRINLVLLTCLMDFWDLVVIIKYACQNDLMTSLLWYSFYLPLLAIPLTIFLTSLHVAGYDKKPWLSKLRNALYVCGGILCLLVFTNNLHHAVFIFSFSDPTWTGIYSYGIGYAFIVVWQAALYLGSLFILGLSARKELRRLVPLFGGLLAFAALYSVAYVLRLIASNLMITVCFFIVITVELLLRLGFLPTYKNFRAIFDTLPLDIKVLDNTFETVESTNQAEPLTTREKTYLQDAIARNPQAQQVSFKIDRKTVEGYKAIRLHGGWALITEDLSALEKTRRTLNKQQARLQRQNKLLEQDGITQARLYRQAHERELYGEVRTSLSSAVERIRLLLSTLPGHSTPEEAAARKLQLIQIKLLIAYCKRKGSLVLLSRSGSNSNPDFDRERILLMTNEAASDLQAANIECGSLIELREPLPAATVSVLYDCFYDFCMASFAFENPAIMFYLHESNVGSNMVELKLALEGDELQGEPPVAVTETLERLRGTLAQRNVAFGLTSDEWGMNLTVLAARNGGETS